MLPVPQASALAADMTQLNALAAPGVNDALKKTQKRVILLWLAGGASQLETWDPKPGASTGGPFRAIKTDVPGTMISELMPKMAQRMKNTCILRGLDTKNGDHGSAAVTMMRGRRNEAALRYPDLGAVLAREMARADSKGAGLRELLHADRRPRDGPRGQRLPRCSLRSNGSHQ